MAIGTAAGFDILEAVVTMPPSGAWTADLVLDTDQGAGLAGAITIDLTGLELKGTAVRGGTAFGNSTLRVVGGAGGLGKLLAPKDYRGVPLRIPLTDALAAVGETLSITADAAVLAYQLTRWVTFAESAAELIDALADQMRCAWRVLANGTVWLGTDPDSEVTFNFDLLSGDPHLGNIELGVEVPVLVPGLKFLGRQVAQVEHIIAEAGVRTVVTFS